MPLVNGVRAAEHAGMPRKKFDRWVKAGIIPVLIDPVTGTKAYSTESIDRWLASFEALPKDGAA